MRISVKCGKCGALTGANPTILSLYKFRCFSCGLEADLRDEAEKLLKAEDFLRKLRDAEVHISVELKIKEV